MRDAIGIRRVLTAGLLTVTVAAGGVACGSSKKSAKSSATTTTAAPTTTTTTMDEATAKAQITANFTKFFNGADTDVNGKLALLEDGDKYRDTFIQSSQGAAAKASSTRVTAIEFLTAADCSQSGIPSPCAKVTNDLLVNGQPALSGQKSYAVYVNGQWKVAAITYCGLIALGGSKCPGQ